jgi:hypothetical protein
MKSWPWKERRHERYRARLVRQEVMAGRNAPGRDDGPVPVSRQRRPRSADGDYYGGKWNIHLRPDLWFKLLDVHGDSYSLEMCRCLGDTGGNDRFFFPIDCSADCLKPRITR